ncbi:hypothetical protein [Sphingobium sp. HWE2-09]|uniref:hypothetical protein n=1 Tax=Sphingobium sp. HWE2-09 TaxID=3108390 RepID=UPI002DCCFDFE|nr:hypothetical protein [Sphingobium sp. HWE2-09]
MSKFWSPFLASPSNSQRPVFRAEKRDGLINAQYDLRVKLITGLFQQLRNGDPRSVGTSSPK